MGLEKVAGNGAASYQGSAAAAGIEASAQAVNEVQKPSVGAGGEDARKRTEEWMNNSQLKNAVSDLNKQLKDTEAVFGVHEKTNRITIKIVDRSTKEVLKEYPPEQTLDIIAKVWEIAGLLVDEKG